MPDPQRRLRSALGLIVATSLTIGALGLPRPAAAVVALPTWDGGIDLYRDGVYSVQKSWLWCTAAGVQIVSNIVDVDSDHSTTAQRRYFAWMRQEGDFDVAVRVESLQTPDLFGRAGLMAYTATKFAVRSLTDALRQEIDFFLAARSQLLADGIHLALAAFGVHII